MMRPLLVAAGAVVVVAGLAIAWLTRPTVPEHDDVPGPSAAPPRGAPGMHAPPPPRPTQAPVLEAVRVSPPPALPAPADAPSQRTPRRASFDAVRLYETQGGDVLALFAAEPRDEAWAQEREGDIVSQALPEFQDVDHDVRVEVECHTATCRVRVHSRKPILTEESSFYPLTCLSSYTVPEWGTPTASDSDETPYSDFYMIFGPDTRGRAGFLARRDGTCARYRDGWRQRALK